MSVEMLKMDNDTNRLCFINSTKTKMTENGRCPNKTLASKLM